jgi:ABC-type branched-subunit amino acid transport system substrate-binding protein
MNQGQKYYHVGGDLNIDDPSYIERQADRNLYEKLEAGNFCYVFNSRQMGKSSLRVRVKKNLETAGFKCVVISLDKLGAKGFTEEQWYNSLIKNIADKFDLQTESLSYLTPLDRLSYFFENKLLAENEQRIVIFIDEIDTVLSLDFPTDDFFAFIRFCYNERANNPIYERVTFVLLGVATPSQLIQNTRRTPFNIGEAIQLNGFSLQEARPLTRGLEGKINDPIVAEYILKEILKWTGGQPFLTQKIFKIIADDENIIPSDENLISKWIEGLVKLRIIENWEYQDEPQHLRTIHNRIINSKEPLVKLLKFYLKVLQNRELPVNDSLEQSELILSGLLEERNGKLKVYNLIYELVFNSNWVEQMRADTRPYEEQLLIWLSSKRQDKSSLLQGEQLQKAIAWRDGKVLNIEDYQFINASEEREIANLEIKIQKKERFQRLLAGITFSMMIIAGISGLQLQTIIQSNVFRVPYVSDPERFSQGERTFFLGNSNLYLNLGVQAFKEGNYPQAIEFFKKAKTIDKTDPEAEIYYNNARAHQREIEQNKKPLTLAVVVLLNQRRVVAQEILKGVALAQTNWNDRGGLKGHLLNIVIANDEGDPSLAQKVAQEFNKDSNILGVIGHYTSPTTESTMPEYDKAGLAMISPGSTSTKLIEKRSKQTNKVFFRTTPSDKFSGQLLANYAIKNNIKKAVICTSKDIFSVSIKEAFFKSFQDRGGEIVETIDLANPFNASDTLILSILRKKPDAAVFFPNTEQIPIAINIAQEIKNTQSGLRKKPQLLGGNTLYGVDILRSGQDAIEGLTVTIPWFPEEANKSQFVKQASQRWQGVVTWQNATSYDATQAFIKALSESKEKEPTRATVLANIPKIQLLPDETSGGGLKFTKNGEREMKPALVRVVRCSAQKCVGMEGGFYFEKVPKS